MVEELDVLPHLALLAGRERRDLLRAERFGFARGRLERAEFDLEDAGSHVVLDQRLKGAFGEGPANGALQVCEVLHRDRSVLASQCVAALGDAADEARDGVDGGVRFVPVRREAMRFRAAARRDHDPHDDDDHDCRDDPQLDESSAAFGRVERGLFHLPALSARLLAPLLAGQILLIVLHGAHRATFTGFRSTLPKYVPRLQTAESETPAKARVFGAAQPP